METVGTVIRVDGLKTVVEIQRVSACTGECKDCAGCETKSMRISALADIAVSVGDRVRVASESKAVLYGLFVLFILPLFVPSLVYLLTVNSGFGGWFALGALALVLIFIWRLSKSLWYFKKTQPYIIEVLSERES